MNKDLILSRRVYLLIAVMAVWGTVIGARLYFLQVVQSSVYREKAENQQQQTLDIMSPRGTIYDSNGSALALSVQVKSVFAVPREVRDIYGTAKTLASLTGLPAADIREKLSADRRFVWIKRKVSNPEASAIEKAGLAGIHFEDESRRSYPNVDLAAQVLGYVGLDEQGLGGLEGEYNDIVRGQPGRVVYFSDAHGKSYNQLEHSAQPGADLITTIDKSIQHFVEQEIREAEERTHAKGIYIIVMDPNTGGILAMANYPTFDPNNFAKYDKQFLKNGAIDHTYEPGSTFKILTVGAALEESLTSPEDQIDCLLGSIVVAGKRIHDHKPFGVLTVSEILQKSSDVGAITLGLRLREDRMAKYIKLYGFGKQTGIDLPGEERGLTRPTSQWTKSSIGYISMGQEIAVTPLQIARLVSMVANGGTLYRPYVVKEVRDSHQNVLTHTEPSGQRVMSLKSAQEMQDMLEKVVTNGTATPAKLEGYRAAGKTGTAQKSEGAGYSATKLVASFAGFAPASNPAISMVVVVDEPVGSHHGGEVAAPIFKHIADQILHYKGISPDIQDYAPRYIATPGKHQSAPTPTAKPAESDELKIVSASLPGSIPATSYPAGDITVPDFLGKSERQAYEESRRLGLTTNANGLGRVTQQNPPAGANVRLGTIVELRLSTK
jgi:cell division protein FtsI/penicillin-binding protein 2